MARPMGCVIGKPSTSSFERVVMSTVYLKKTFQTPGVSSISCVVDAHHT